MGQLPVSDSVPQVHDLALGGPHREGAVEPLPRRRGPRTAGDGNRAADERRVPVQAHGVDVPGRRRTAGRHADGSARHEGDPACTARLPQRRRHAAAVHAGRDGACSTR